MTVPVSTADLIAQMQAYHACGYANDMPITAELVEQVVARLKSVKHCPTPAKADETTALEIGPVPSKSLAELRREVRDCIGETIPLRGRWVSAIMRQVVVPLQERNATLLTDHAVEVHAREAAESQNRTLRARNHVEHQVWLSEELARAEARADRLAAENERLKAALKPFDEAVDDLGDGAKDRDHLWESPAAIGLTAGNLRAARTALNPTEEVSDV